MIITVELEDEDFNHLHDVILEALDYDNSNLNNIKIKKIWDNLPNDIISTAIRWGTSDSVFRDNMYVEIQKNIEKYKKLIK